MSSNNNKYVEDAEIHRKAHADVYTERILLRAPLSLVSSTKTWSPQVCSRPLPYLAELPSVRDVYYFEVCFFIAHARVAGHTFLRFFLTPSPVVKLPRCTRTTAYPKRGKEVPKGDTPTSASIEALVGCQVRKLDIFVHCHQA